MQPVCIGVFGPRSVSQLTEASLTRKRGREVAIPEDGISTFLPYHVRAVDESNGSSSFLSLRGCVLDLNGQFNTSGFPGLTFFYEPRVESIAGGTVVLGFPSTRPVAQKIQQLSGYHPCPVHGPFPCPCHAMHTVADIVAQLLAEVFLQDSPFDVAIDCYRKYPHIRIDSLSKTWEVCLVGLPLPDRIFGPFPTGKITSPQSIKSHWLQYIEKSRIAADPCVMCGSSTPSRCMFCHYRLCKKCTEVCGRCGANVCQACCFSAVGDGVTCCYSCTQ